MHWVIRCFVSPGMQGLRNTTPMKWIRRLSYKGSYPDRLNPRQDVEWDTGK